MPKSYPAVPELDGGWKVPVYQWDSEEKVLAEIQSDFDNSIIQPNDMNVPVVAPEAIDDPITHHCVAEWGQGSSINR